MDNLSACIKPGITAVLLLALAGVAEADRTEEKLRTATTVTVDCARGDTVAKALEKKADELVIEIRGICEESVRIARSKVTLRGSDPDTDGIRGDGKSPNTVMLEGNAFEIRLENLTVYGPPITGASFALGMAGFSIDVVNCRIEGTRGGAIVGGFGGFEDTTIRSGGGATALVVGSGSGSGCTRCTIFGTGAVEVSLSTCLRCPSP